jgi:hypothetical protein
MNTIIEKLNKDFWYLNSLDLIIINLLRKKKIIKNKNNYLDRLYLFELPMVSILGMD